MTDDHSVPSGGTHTGDETRSSGTRLVHERFHPVGGVGNGRADAKGVAIR